MYSLFADKFYFAFPIKVTDMFSIYCASLPHGVTEYVFFFLKGKWQNHIIVHLTVLSLPGLLLDQTFLKTHPDDLVKCNGFVQGLYTSG